jgi:hypothetical protein
MDETVPVILTVCRKTDIVLVKVDQRKPLVKTSTTKAAKSFYRQIWKTTSDAVSEHDIEHAKLSRVERARARYLDRLAKGLPLTQGR